MAKDLYQAIEQLLEDDLKKREAEGGIEPITINTYRNHNRRVLKTLRGANDRVQAR
jgi:hypothetical protein